MSQRGPKSSKPPTPDGAAAAAFGQDLLTQLAHDLGAQKQREAQKKQAAADLANALLSKVATDFASVPPPPPSIAPAAASQAPPAPASVAPTSPGPTSQAPTSQAPTSQAPTSQAPAPTPTTPLPDDAELSPTPLSAEELADLDAMTAPGGFWGKLFTRLRKRQ